MSSKKILVVDDDPAIRILVGTVLQHAGYVVEEAVDGLAALKAIESSMPDLVITDITMPNVDGFEFAEGLRHYQGTKELPLIFLTASDATTSFAKSVALKSRAFLIKPVTQEKLLAAVRVAIG